MKEVKINAYSYAELSEDSKANVNYKYFLDGFDYEDEDEDGNITVKYDYFQDWELYEQIEFCDDNDYMFDVYGYLLTNYKEIQVA